MTTPFPFCSALITGASSGIGRALAVALAGPGMTLHLSGRDPERLRETQAECVARGAAVVPRVLDTRDAGSMAEWISGVGALDLVIANAGVAAGNLTGTAETPDQTRLVISTNLDGALNTVLPAMEVMRGQPIGADGLRGRIAVIASIAAFVPVPGAAAYCASKSAIDTWIVATAPRARQDGISLSSICPGYIRTPMTAQNAFAMPGLMDADRAATLILRGIIANRPRLVFPRWIGIMSRLIGLLPPGWLNRLMPGDTNPARGTEAAP